MRSVMLLLLPALLSGCPSPPRRDADAQAVLRVADRALATAEGDYAGGAVFRVAGTDPARSAELLAARRRGIAAARAAVAAYAKGAQ